MSKGKWGAPKRLNTGSGNPINILKDHPDVDRVQLVGGVMGVLAVVTHILAQPVFLACGEQVCLKLLVAVTSDDPTSPVNGGELWEAMKAKFPSERGGVDSSAIIAAMAQRIMQEI